MEARGSGKGRERTENTRDDGSPDSTEPAPENANGNENGNGLPAAQYRYTLNWTA